MPLSLLLAGCMADRERGPRSCGARRCDVAGGGFLATASEHAAHAIHGHADVGADSVDLSRRSPLVGEISIAYRDTLEAMEGERHTEIVVLVDSLGVLDDADRTRRCRR